MQESNYESIPWIVLIFVTRIIQKRLYQDIYVLLVHFCKVRSVVLLDAT
jgi:hypothetical protein